MPGSIHDIVGLIRDIKANYMGDKIFAWVEKVHAMPGNGVTSTWSFSGNFHTLLTSLAAADIPYDFVTPQKWQKELCGGPKAKDMPKPKWKDKLLDDAKRLFPCEFVGLNKGQSLKICDALLILEWVKRFAS